MKLRDKIIEAAKLGWSEKFIAKYTGVTPEEVLDVITEAVRQGEDIPGFSKPCGRPKGSSGVYLDPDLVKMIAPEAKKRGLNVAEFARHLLRTICYDNLFDAVLDDAEHIAKLEAGA